jgi:hypothetical protein
MARGVTLAKARDLMKVECGEAIATNTAVDNELYAQMEAMQELLAGEYDWPFMQTMWDATYVAASRYIDAPTQDVDGTDCTPNYERPLLVEAFYNDRWHQLDYGIGACQYNMHNVDEVVGGAILRWQLRGTRIEVWPISSDAQTIRFTGERGLLTLRDESDEFDVTKVLDLDHLMLVYFCAAERLARLEQMDAAAKLQKARQRLLTIRGQYPTYSGKLTIGHWRTDDMELKKVVAVGGATGGTASGLLALDGADHLALDQ